MTPQILAHLWQSTLFVGAAWLVTLALRTNRAQVRYWVWLTASLKFLIPFSLLIGLGTLIPRPAAIPHIRPTWGAVINESTPPPALPQVAPHTSAQDHSDITAAFALWTCGFLTVAMAWLVRWRRVHLLRRSARLVDLSTALQIPVPVMLAPDLLEPGVYGLLRPVLLLPDGIVQRLSQAQMDAILTHEFCHVRRKDNLTAAIHMAVQAIFWFHPLTWWIGSRLVGEREEACDEEVLRQGCQPHVYAESILTVCKLYLESPLACASGITGSDLKKRIESIMRHRTAAGLNFGKKLFLTVAAMTVLIIPFAFGILTAPFTIQAQDEPDWQTKAGGKMSFEVASIKKDTGPFRRPSFPLDPGEAYNETGGRFFADFPLPTYITFAYKLSLTQEQRETMLAHLPKWVAEDRFAIEAKAAHANPTKDQMRLMMQALLADRFNLAVHFETQESPVLALVLVKPGKLGPKLRPHSEGPSCDAEPSPDVFPPKCYVTELMVKSGVASGGSRDTTMPLIAEVLPSMGRLARPVVDQTGLSGKVDFALEWTPEPDTFPPPPGEPAPNSPEGPSFQQALREQLGLKLESAKAPLRIMIVDKVEPPSEN